MGRLQGWAAARAGRPVMRSPASRCWQARAPAAVLGRGADRQAGTPSRTPGFKGWRVPGGRYVMVSDSGGSGRAPRDAVGAVLVVRAAGGDRDLAGPGVRVARSPGVPAGRRQRSRGSCAGTLQPGAAGWSTGPWPPSGMQICGHAVRNTNWLRTRSCESTCKTGSPGMITRPGGEAVPGPDVRWTGRRHGRRADRRWARSWSPEQIANRLRADFPTTSPCGSRMRRSTRRCMSRAAARCGVS